MNGTTAIRIGAILGGLGVLAGTFGAHGLETLVEPDQLEIFETGVRYQMYHALALIAVGLVAIRIGPNTALMAAGWLFLFGTVVFPGSLYGVALAQGRADWLGMIAPFGGTAFIIGWFVMAWGARSSQPSQTAKPKQPAGSETSEPVSASS